MSRIEVAGYVKVTVTHGAASVTIAFDDDPDVERAELIMWPSESKALRKALKVAEQAITKDDKNYYRGDSLA